MPKKSSSDDALGFILGLIGVGGAIAIAAHLSQPKCPYCQHHIPKGSNPCPRCQTPLYW
jgi:hypothetical protein